jgi:hypothetical protein
MESFGVAFPRIYLDSGFKGWFVSTLLLGTFDLSEISFVICNKFQLHGLDL